MLKKLISLDRLLSQVKLETEKVWPQLFEDRIPRKSGGSGESNLGLPSQNRLYILAPLKPQAMAKAEN